MLHGLALDAQHPCVGLRTALPVRHLQAADRHQGCSGAPRPLFEWELADAALAQYEVPDPWLEGGNPWEIIRLDNAVEVKLYGEATRGEGGKGPGSWTGGLEVLAVPYDLPIPGFATENTNNIRLWASRPKKAYAPSSRLRRSPPDVCEQLRPCELQRWRLRRERARGRAG